MRDPSAAAFSAMLAAPPGRNSSSSTFTIGTGASGECVKWDLVNNDPTSRHRQLIQRQQKNLAVSNAWARNLVVKSRVTFYLGQPDYAVDFGHLCRTLQRTHSPARAGKCHSVTWRQADRLPAWRPSHFSLRQRWQRGRRTAHRH
jgi:hypothetical protein